MKTCRKSVATVLPLLIHLLTLRIGDAVAERNDTSVRVDPKIILEEVIITGSGNGTRIIADALVEDASTIGDRILPLLSKREVGRRGHSKQTSSNLDQDVAQSRVIIDVDDEDNLERLKRVIAKYEPQRITSTKIKRKIVNDAHDVLQGKAAGSTTDLERAYDEVLRNISRRAPELTSSNVDATLNPYLTQTRKNLREIYIPKATILSAKDDEAQKSRPNVDSSFTSPTLRDKKKKLFKKYLQLNRTITIPRGSPVEESRLNEETADGDESNTPESNSKVLSNRTKPKNESIQSSLNIYSESTEEPGSRRGWNVQDSLVQTVPLFIPQSNDNNSYNAFNVNNLNNLNFPSDANTVQLLSKYNMVPRPFSSSRSPDSSVIETSYKKPSPSPASFNRQQIARSSANVLPLILPTETLLDARRYVPIKRANHLKPEGGFTTLVNTEATPLTSPADERTTLADYSAPYTDSIGITKSPLVTVNQRRISSPNYYAITENPMERSEITPRTDYTRLIHIPNQISTSHSLLQEKDPQAARGNGFLPKITSNSPDEKSNSNANARLALYNKFGSLYSANAPNVLVVPKDLAQNYPNFRQPVQSLHALTSQHVSTPPYATSEPISPPLLKRPITFAKSTVAPYYDSRLLVSQRIEGKELNDDKKNKENVEINESRATDANESSTKDADNENNFENDKTRFSEAYKSHKTSNKQREKEDREEEDRDDRYEQSKRNYGHQDKYHEYDKDDKDDKNDDVREKYNIRHEDKKDEEEDADESQEDENVNARKNADERNHDRYQFNNHKYDRDDSEEEEHDKQRYDRKKYDTEKNRRDEHDRETDKYKFVSNSKYFEGPRYRDYEIREPDEKYRKHYDQRKPARDKKDRDEDSEDESFAEDKLIARRSKDERADERRRQREEYEKKQNKDDKTTYKRKYHPHRQAIPRRDSRHEEQKDEEYGETNPKHIREEYHRLRQDVKDDDRRHDSENHNEKTRDHEHGETQEHAHKHEEHHEKKKDGGDHEFKEGGGAEHKHEHHGHEGEKGHKGYKVWHEHEKAEKGHHNKEHGSKEYDEKDGEEKKHDEEGGFHKEHHRGEASQKEAEFGEKGEHKKGHSTHGEHSVHKKDEYEKKTEFFDEFHEDGGAEKHGEHHHDHESKKGGHEKKGHHDAADHEQKYGKEEKHEKGGHHHEHKGHKIDEGHDHHHDHDEKYGKKEGHEQGKKWSFKKGDNGGGHNR